MSIVTYIILDVTRLVTKIDEIESNMIGQNENLKTLRFKMRGKKNYIF